MYKLIFSFLLTFLFTYSYGYQIIFSSDSHALFKSKIAITAKIIPSDKNNYQVILLSFLKKTPGITLNIGDTITVSQSNYYNFGSVDIPHQETYLMYLSPFQHHWYAVGGKQNIYPVVGNKLPFRICDKQYEFNSEDFIKMKQHLFMCFEEFYDNRFKPIYSQADYIKREDAMDAVYSFYECCHYPENHRMVPLKKVNYIRLNRTFVNPDSIIHTYCHRSPELSIAYSEYRSFVQSLLPDSIQNKSNKLHGSIMVQLVVEPDSTRSNYKIVRGLTPAYDSLAIDVMKHFPLITPGIYKDKAARCLMNFPIRFE